MKLVKTVFSINLGQFVTSFGDHPCYEGGSQILLKFPNGWGASIAYVPAGTQGIELQPFRYSGDWWELVGGAVPHVDVLQIYDLLINIYSLNEGGGYVC
jgi:hypothetical protein